jgi:alpha-D-ribose 1-methylphosphonate 5-triphosphate synthase subunit PhnH
LVEVAVFLGHAPAIREEKEKMRKVLAAVVACGVLFSVASARPEPNAFLNKTAPTVAALVAQVKKDPEVRDRYMRHFAMNEQELVQYLSTLKIAPATEDNVYTVYAAPDNGALRSKLTRVKKGTKLYVDASGEPVMLWNCGNPLTRGPKQPLASNELETEPSGSTEEVLRSVPMKTPDSILEASIPGISEPGVPDVPFVVSTPGESDIPIVPAVGGGFPAWLGLVPGLVLIGGNGGGNNPVPEPATMAVLGIGAAALMRRRKK